jgi:hypothetical protein
MPATTEPRRETIREDARLRAADATGVVLGEAVRDLGLDPSRVLAVIPAECARGGRISRNGTLYPPEEMSAQHLALCEAAKARFVEGQQEHPEAGLTWNVPVRLFDGDVVTESDGSVLTRGRFAVLNTTSGRDLLTLWQEGLDIGVSLYGGAYVEPRTLTRESPYAAMNPGRVGQTYRECAGLVLERYDVVRDASFLTHFQPASEQAREAYQRVLEAFRGDAGADTHPSRAPGQGAQTQETQMTIQTIDDLRAAHPELVKMLVEEAARQANPLATLDPTQRQLAERVLEAVGRQQEPDVKAALQAVRESSAADRERLATLEAAQRDTAEQLKQVREQAETERKARQAMEAKLAVVECLDGLAKGRGALGERVKQFVREEADAGRVASADQAKVAFGRHMKLAEDAQRLAAVPGEGERRPTAEGAGEGEGGAGNGAQPQGSESPDSSPAPVAESVAPVLKLFRNAAVGG